MRTTINISDDLMSQIKLQALNLNKTVTAVINDLLRKSLQPVSAPRSREGFRQQTFSMGEYPGVNLKKSLELAAEMETEYSIDKLELGK